MMGLSLPHILILAVVVVLLLGGGRFSNLMASESFASPEFAESPQYSSRCYFPRPGFDVTRSSNFLYVLSASA